MNIFVMVPDAFETMTYERDECLPSSNKSVSFKKIMEWKFHKSCQLCFEIFLRWLISIKTKAMKNGKSKQIGGKMYLWVSTKLSIHFIFVALISPKHKYHIYVSVGGPAVVSHVLYKGSSFFSQMTNCLILRILLWDQMIIHSLTSL